MTLPPISTATIYCRMTIRVYAQPQKPVECGAIIENEFTRQAEIHTCFLEMAPRESFTVSVEPVGEYVVTLIDAYDPAGLKNCKFWWCTFKDSAFGLKNAISSRKV